MRTLLVLFSVCACARSASFSPEFDGGVAADGGFAADAGLPDEPDASADAGSGRDVGPGDSGEGYVYDVPAHSIAGARWGGETSLVVSYERRVEAPIEVWTFEAPEPLLDLRARVVRGTDASRVAHASRWDDRIAIAVEQPSGPHEVHVVSAATGRTLTRWAFDPSLMTPRVLHAYVAIARSLLLVVWLDPDSRIQYALAELPEEEGGDVVELARAPGRTDSLPGALRLAEEEPRIGELLRARHGAGIDHVEARFDLSWVADGASVAAYDRGRLFVDGAPASEDVPRFHVHYGRLAYAQDASDAVAALSTADGMFAAVIEGDSVTWSRVDTRFPAGPPVAHVGADHRGVFFVEGALGRLPSRLRWVPR